ncbi:MAG: hypothetical protein HKN91_17725 [Acidimicrobiia bacterium]|nr:hypothetical protein [Acidimicrobiia bacterium]
MTERIPFVEELRSDLLESAPNVLLAERSTERLVGRRLLATIGGFVLVGLLGGSLLLTTGSSGDSVAQPRSDVLVVRMEGKETRVVVDDDGRAVACRLGLESGIVPLNPSLQPRPPVCSWDIEIGNLDPSTLPNTQSLDGVMWTKSAVVLVGELDPTSLTLTLTELPRPFVVGDDPTRDFGLNAPCDPPTGGYIEEWGQDFRISNTGVRILRDYGEAEWDTFAGGWADGRHFVYTMAFTGDLDRHRAALAELYGGPLCVWQLDHTRHELEQALAAVDAANVPIGQSGPTVLGMRIDEISNTVEVVLWLGDETAIAPFEQIDEDILNIRSWMNPVR